MAKRPVVDLDQLAALKGTALRDAAEHLRTMADALDEEADNQGVAVKSRRPADEGRDALGRRRTGPEPAGKDRGTTDRDAFGRRR